VHNDIAASLVAPLLAARVGTEPSSRIEARLAYQLCPLRTVLLTKSAMPHVRREMRGFVAQHLEQPLFRSVGE
jgi:hypothetical protein